MSSAQNRPYRAPPYICGPSPDLRQSSSRQPAHAAHSFSLPARAPRAHRGYTGISPAEGCTYTRKTKPRADSRAARSPAYPVTFPDSHGSDFPRQRCRSSHRHSSCRSRYSSRHASNVQPCHTTSGPDTWPPSHARRSRFPPVHPHWSLLA